MRWIHFSAEKTITQPFKNKKIKTFNFTANSVNSLRIKPNLIKSSCQERFMLLYNLKFGQRSLQRPILGITHQKNKIKMLYSIQIYFSIHKINFSFKDWDYIPQTIIRICCCFTVDKIISLLL
jgi:hypothetical protein